MNMDIPAKFVIKMDTYVFVLTDLGNFFTMDNNRQVIGNNTFSIKNHLLSFTNIEFECCHTNVQSFQF